MYGAGNPQMAALGALGALGGTLRELAMAPVRRWGQTSTTHKIIAAGAGAGLAYFLHKKGMADVAVALLGVGGAYAASALMHSRQVVGNGANGAVLPTAPVSGALPPAQVQNMANEAAAVMSNGNGNGMSGSKWGSLAPAAAPPVAPVGAPPPQPQQPVGAPAAPVGAQQPSGGGGSKWALLG